MIRSFTGYQSAEKNYEGIRLNANEGVRGEYNKYPLKRDQAVLKIFSQLYGVTTNELMMDRGIDGVLEVLFNAFVEKGDRLLGLSPTYGMYQILADMYGASYGEVKSEKLITEIKNSPPKILFLCRPNNPTGEIVPKELVYQILEILPKDSLLVVDEAYIEFDLIESLLPMIKDVKNVLILRTLSKAYSLASLRVGFGIGNEELIRSLIPFQAPYPLSGPVLEYLRCRFDDEYITQTRQEIERVVIWRERLSKFFESYGGNFLYRQDLKAKEMFEAFKEEGILIRYFESQGAIRLSIGTDEAMEKVEMLCAKWL